MILKTFKVLHTLYSFVSIIRISRNIKLKSIYQLMQINYNYKRSKTFKSSKV